MGGNMKSVAPVKKHARVVSTAHPRLQQSWRLNHAVRAVECLEHRVLLSTALVAFGQPHQFGVGGVGLGPNAVAIADLNQDAKPDIVVTNSSGHSVSVLLGNGDGSFAL